MPLGDTEGRFVWMLPGARLHLVLESVLSLLVWNWHERPTYLNRQCLSLIDYSGFYSTPSIACHPLVDMFQMSPKLTEGIKVSIWAIDPSHSF